MLFLLYPDFIGISLEAAMPFQHAVSWVYAIFNVSLSKYT